MHYLFYNDPVTLTYCIIEERNEKSKREIKKMELICRDLY